MFLVWGEKKFFSPQTKNIYFRKHKYGTHLSDSYQIVRSQQFHSATLQHCVDSHSSASLSILHRKKLTDACKSTSAAAVMKDSTCWWWGRGRAKSKLDILVDVTQEYVSLSSQTQSRFCVITVPRLATARTLR